jgi:uncharacterized protein YfaS (alpha-2-macroglobulin family)
MAHRKCLRIVLAVLSIYLAAIITAPDAPGQEDTARTAPPALEIGRAQAQEGSDFFTLEVDCYVRVPGQQSAQTPCQILATEAKDYIQVTPRVDFQLVAGNGRVRLIGAFAARTTYTLTFLPGLRAAEQAVLTEAVSRTVQTPAFKPMLRFLGRARYLPPLQGATLPFEARNVERLRVSFRQIFAQNLMFWLTKNQEGASDDVAEEVHQVELRLPAEADAKTTGQIDLDALERFGQGVFHVAVSLVRADNTLARLDSATVVITDLAAIAKQDGDDLYVWTRAARDMQAKPEVHVRAMTYSNRELASCTTSGEQAGCVLKDLMRQSRKPYALLLSAGHDLSYLRFNDAEIVDERVHAGMRPYTEEGAVFEAYVYSSRGVYRPGETVNLGAVVWTTTRQAAQQVPLQWQILTSRNKVLKEVSMQSSVVGMATLDVPLDTLAPTGKYQAILKSGNKTLQTYGFFVEEFVPERIGVTVNAPDAVVVGEGPAVFEVAAHYLFGPPVADGEYTVRCTLEPAWFTVPGQAEFATGIYTQQPPRPLALESVAGRLDTDGRATAVCAYERFVASFPTVMQVRADVEVSEAGSGRVTLQSGTALAAATDEILGLRLLRAANNQIQVEGRLFTPSGADSQRQTQVQVSLYRVLNNFVYVFDPEYGYHRWQREEILLPAGDESTLAVNQGHFEALFSTAEPFGAYVVHARLADKAVVTDLKVSLGFSWFWQAMEDDATPRPASPDRLQVSLSNSPVPAGEVVKVRFEAPFDGYLLFAVESDRLLHSRWVKVSRGPQEFDVTAPAVLPNVYVSVLLLKEPVEGEFYVPGRAWGSVPLHIVPQAHILPIDVDVPETMRPQQELVVRLRAAPPEPAAPTQFTVAVVDEGILQLTDFRTPNPLDYFFAARRLGVRSFETVGWTFARTLEAAKDPGGGAETAGVKPGVVPVTIVSWWSGIVDADASGEAVVRVPIPQFQGKVRLMVVGATADRVGSAERFVTVRDPLVMQATLPRFLGRDDAFTIPIMVVNTTAEAQEVTVTVQANAAIALERAVATETIAPQQSRRFTVPARVTDFAGTAVFNIVASSGSLITKERLQIPILPLTPEQSLVATVPAGQEVALADLLPADLRPEELQLEVSVSTVPFLQELGHLRYLLHYPYGCIEQTASGTFPLLYVSDLLQWADPEALKERDVADMVYAGLNRLISMQTTSGGFGYWPGDNEPTLWGTAYVTHLLLKARELGYEVPASTLRDALDFLQEAVSSRRDDYDRRYGVDLTHTEPYMLYVLGLAGRHRPERLRQLAQQPPKWDVLATENEFLLMLAAALAGERSVYEAYVGRPTLLQPVAAVGRHYGGTFWSSLRTDAMRLSLAEEVRPGDPALEPLGRKVASSLQAERYLTTQEAAWAVSALGQRAQRFRGADVSNVTLQVQGRTVPPTLRQKDIPMWLFSGPSLIGQTLKVVPASDPAPFVYVKMRGYRRHGASVPAAPVPFTLTRRYLDLRGEPLPPGGFVQGQLAVVELTLESTAAEDIPNVALVDRLPAGLEIENPRLGREHRFDWMPPEGLFEPDYLDLRDNRMQIFGTLPSRAPRATHSTSRFYYVVRAVTAGTFTAPSALLEIMYDPDKVYYTEAVRVSVTPR